MKSENYKRVIPRDFFNEAKLLKCYGHLCIKMGDGSLPDGLLIEIKNTGKPFDIRKDPASGDLELMNYPVKINGQFVVFRSGLNAKSAYPFFCIVNEEEITVFNDDGSFTDDFADIVNKIKS